MSNHTKTATAHPYLSPEWLYDTLMEQIDPDLTLENIKMLDEKYKGETAEQKEQRNLRYQASFEIYDECLEELDWVLAEDAKTVKEEMALFADAFEAHDKTTDEKRMNDSIDSSSGK